MLALGRGLQVATPEHHSNNPYMQRAASDPVRKQGAGRRIGNKETATMARSVTGETQRATWRSQILQNVIGKHKMAKHQIYQIDKTLRRLAKAKAKHKLGHSCLQAALKISADALCVQPPYNSDAGNNFASSPIAQPPSASGLRLCISARRARVRPCR